MYKLYPRNLARASTPVVSATRVGRITLNAAAARIFVEKRVEHVFLMWDADARKFALKASEKADATAYELRFAPDNAGAGFSAKPFLRLIGFEFEETMPLSTAWNETEQLFEVTLPTGAFNKRHRFPRQRRSKRNATTSEENSERETAGAVTA